MSLKISVIVVTHNRTDKVLRLIGSFVELGCIPDEFIVVENAGNDITCKQISEAYPFVKILRKSSQKLTEARNLGMRSAHGDILLLLDDDMVCEDGSILERIQLELAKDKSVGCVALSILDVQSGEIMNRGLEQDSKGFWQAAAFTKEAVRQTGDFNIDYTWCGHEYDYGIRLRDRGYKIRYSEDIRILHDDGGASCNVSRRKYRMAYHLPSWTWLFASHFRWRRVIIYWSRLWLVGVVGYLRRGWLDVLFVAIFRTLWGLPRFIIRHRCVVSRKTEDFFWKPTARPMDYSMPILPFCLEWLRTRFKRTSSK